MILSTFTRQAFFLLATCAGLSFWATVARAEVFFSGRVDINGGVAGGNAVLLAKEINAVAGGFSYQNQWTSGTSGLAAAGNKVTTLGFAPISAVRVGNSVADLATDLDLVAIYAFEGVSEPASAGQSGLNQRANYNSSVLVPAGTLGNAAGNSRGGGVVRFYDRRNPSTGDSAALDVADPTTWVQNFSDLNAGLVAELTVDFQADAYLQGAPGGSDTTIPVVVSSEAVNTSPFDTTGALLSFVSDFKLRFNQQFVGATNGSPFLFNNPDVEPIPNTLTNTTLDLLVRFRQTAPQTGAQPVPDQTNLANMNEVFDGLLDAILAGSHPFSDETVPLGPNALDTSQNFGSGDLILENTGGVAVPGGQFVPEPPAAALAVIAWILLPLTRRRS